MSLEWISPIVTTIGAMVTAGAGAFLGVRLEKRKAIQARAQDKASEALKQLRLVQRNPKEISSHREHRNPEGDPSPTEIALDDLGISIHYILDSRLRGHLETVYYTINAGSEILYFVPIDDDFMRHTESSLIWRACKEGIDLLGGYLRGESTPKESAKLKQWRTALDKINENLS